MKKIIVNGNEIVWEENLTVRGVLTKMNYTFKMLVIKINGNLVRKADYDTTVVPDGAVVDVIHLISGG